MDVGIEGVDDVLLVEDNLGDVRLIEEAFRSSPFDPTIHATETRAEALDLLNRRGEYEEASRPDLVLLDWHLSRHTGQEVIQAAKSVTPVIPVVVMTGSNLGVERVKSSTPAADEYIEKRTDPQEYIDVLRSCGPEP